MNSGGSVYVCGGQESSENDSGKDIPSSTYAQGRIWGTMKTNKL
jgi:hypothetical protein